MHPSAAPRPLSLFPAQQLVDEPAELDDMTQERVVAEIQKHLHINATQQLWCTPDMPKGSSAKAQKAAQYPLFEDTFRTSLATKASSSSSSSSSSSISSVPNSRSKSSNSESLDRFVRLPRAFGLAAFAGAPGFEGWHAKMLGKLNPAPNLRRFVGTLRPYQQEAVDHVVAKLREVTSHSGILQGDCGCGKTLMGFNLMHRFGLPTMVVVHTGVLLEQWLARLSETLPDAKVGILRADERPAPDADVCLAMVHTVIRLSRPEARKYRRYGLLLVDETHIIGARTFSTAVRLVCPPFVLGLSATPKRNDGLHAQVEWLTGPVLYRIDNTSTDVDVQPIRYADPHFEFAVHECRWDKNRDGKVDSTATITSLVEDPSRTAVLVSLAREAVAEGRHTLVLSERVQLLVAMEQALGADVCGRIQAGKSKAVLAANEIAKTKRVVLASFKMAFVGLDIPQLDTLVFASPLKVREDFKQPIGRIQRGGTGMRARIYDVYDAAGYFLGYFAGHVAYYRQHAYTVLPQRRFERVYGETARTDPRHAAVPHQTGPHTGAQHTGAQHTGAQHTGAEPAPPFVETTKGRAQIRARTGKHSGNEEEGAGKEETERESESDSEDMVEPACNHRSDEDGNDNDDDDAFFEAAAAAHAW